MNVQLSGPGSSWSRSFAYTAVQTICATQLYAGTMANWSQPVDGHWVEASKWDVGRVPNNGVPDGILYDVMIGAEGRDYTVSMSTDLSLDSLLVTSGDATLSLDGGSLSVVNGLQIGEKPLQLRGSDLHRTELRGPGSVVISADLDRIELDAVTLTNTTMRGSDAIRRRRGVSFTNGLSLDQGTILVDSVMDSFHVAGRIDGIGEINVTAPRATLYFEGSAVLGPGITTRVSAGRTVVAGSDLDVLVNDGTMVADGGRLLIRVPQFENHGELVVRDGGLLATGALTGNLGQLTIQSGGTAVISGRFTIDRTISIPDSGTLTLGGLGAITNLAGVSVDSGGTLELRTINGPTGPITFSENATVRFTTRVTIPQLLALHTRGDTSIELASGTLDLESSVLDLADVTGQLALSGGEISNGTLRGRHADQLLLASNGGELSDINLDARMAITGGTVHVKGVTQIDQGVTVNHGAGIILDGNWTNRGGIVVNGGFLSLATVANDLGPITMNSATLRIQQPMTFTQVMELGIVGVAAYDVGRNGVLDLQGQTFDLETFGTPLRLLPGGELRRGTVVDGSGLAEIVMERGNIYDSLIAADMRIAEPSGLSWITRSTIESNVHLEPGAGLRLRDSSVIGSQISGGDPSRLAFFDVTGQTNVLDHASFDNVDVIIRKATILNGITVNGEMSMVGHSEARFVGTQHIDGAAHIRFSTDAAFGGAIFVEAGDLTLGSDVHVSSNTKGSRILANNSSLINHGTMSAMNDHRREHQNFNQPTLTINARQFQNLGAVEVSPGGTLRINVPTWTNDGAIVMNDGSIELTGETFVNGTEGVVEGTGSFDVSDVAFINDGSFALGGGPLMVIGDYQQSGTGSLRVSIDSPLSTGMLDVTGNVILGGSLEVDVIENYEPQLGEAFEIIASDGSVSGVFDSSSFPPLDSVLSWQLTYGSQSVILSVVPVPEPAGHILLLFAAIMVIQIRRSYHR